MSHDLDQTVIVDNRPGGGSTIGTHYVARVEPDGHTVLLISSNFTINDTLLRNINYDAAKDFAPVSIAANSPMVLVTNPKSGINSVKQLIDLSKEKPGTLNYGSGGNGTGAHLTMELLKSESGLDIMHIPYKGHGPATTALLSGEVAAIFLQMGNALPQIEAGKLKALAVPHIHRSPLLPEVPTIAEEVLPGFDVIPWFGVVAPAGTPQRNLDTLNASIHKALQDPDVKAQLQAGGADPVMNSPAEFKAFIDSEITRWGQVVKKANAYID